MDELEARFLLVSQLGAVVGMTTAACAVAAAAAAEAQCGALQNAAESARLTQAFSAQMAVHERLVAADDARRTEVSKTTPLQREILTHYYTRRDPFPRASAPAVFEETSRFLVKGLLKYDLVDGVTAIVANQEALAPYMEALAAVPLPAWGWTMPK